jgi:hypothetical protein
VIGGEANGAPAGDRDGVKVVVADPAGRDRGDAVDEVFAVRREPRRLEARRCASTRRLPLATSIVTSWSGGAPVWMIAASVCEFGDQISTDAFLARIRDGPPVTGMTIARAPPLASTLP